MSKFVFNTYKDNPPEGVCVMATITDAEGNEFEAVVKYTNTGGSDYDERLYKSFSGEVLGYVEKWRFLTNEEMIKHGY